MDKRFPAMWLVPLKCGNTTMYSYDFILQKLWNKINLKSCVHLQYISKKMSVKRSSFLQKLLSTSSNLLKKELRSSHFRGAFQKLWNKANKEAVSAFRTFPEKCLFKCLEKFRWSLFLVKLQTSSSNLNTNQLHCSNLQGVF